jgi:hypothetical protein
MKTQIFIDRATAMHWCRFTSWRRRFGAQDYIGIVVLLACGHFVPVALHLRWHFSGGVSVMVFP